MVYYYKQNESNSLRRRVYMILVQSVDGISEATGQTGTPYLAKNGATGVATTNSLVEIDSTNLPGHYYVQLTAAELDTLGFFSIRFKAASTAAFQVVCQCVMDDPYASHTGPGLSLPSGKGSIGGKATAEHLYKEDMIEIAKMVWDVKLRSEDTAKTVLLSKSEFDPSKDQVLVPEAQDGSVAVLEAIKAMDVSEKLEDQHQAVLEAIERKELKDYSASIAALSDEVGSIGKKLNALLAKESETAELRTIAGKLTPKLEATTKELNTAAVLVAELKDQFDTLTTKVDDLADQLAEEIDIEKRMERVGNKVQDKAVLEMVAGLDAVKKELSVTGKKLHVAILDTRIDVNKLKTR